MKTLADNLREQLANPTGKSPADTNMKKAASIKKEVKQMDDKAKPEIVLKLLEYDNTANKCMVHVRFDKQTVDLMNKFKMATNVDVTKFVAFAVRNFFESYPGLKATIKQFIQNTEL